MYFKGTKNLIPYAGVYGLPVSWPIISSEQILNILVHEEENINTIDSCVLTIQLLMRIKFSICLVM
jgi:hypothetical protein